MESDRSGCGCTSSSGVEFVQTGIWWFSVLIFLGYIVVWFMVPTNTFYLHWLPAIQAKTDSIYFGKQGASILVYIFPILLMATLACLYLHLESKRSHYNTQRKVGFFGLVSWKKPLLVNGSLGIISLTELSLVFMFLLYLIWSLYSYLHDWFQQVALLAANERGQVWEAKLEDLALALGLVGNICMVFLFFPVSRVSSVLQFIGLTSDGSIKYHIWLGHTAMVLFTAHGICYIIFWDNTNQISEMLMWNKVGVSNVAGEVALLAGLAMWATTLPLIRRKLYELFFYTHQLYIVFVVFYVLHVGFSSSCVFLAGFYLFLIDRYLRFLQSQQKIQLVSARILPCETVELNFIKNPGLCYAPTSVIYINVGNISKLQWHPFSIISCCDTDPDTLSILIRNSGNWSRSLYQMLSSSSPPSHLNISVEGPYGPDSSTFLSRYEMVVMVSGGSGIAPFISIIRWLLFKANTEGGKAPRVVLVSAFKNCVDLTMIDLLMTTVSGTALDISRLQLQIEAYVTRQKQPATTERNPLETLFFSSNASHEPISSVLGPNTWLCLGIIISSSFILFLLLIAILTKYYIYPIDHNSDLKFPYFLRASLGMLCICVSTVITATSVFMWNKKQNMYIKQIQSVRTNRELESLPHQSFVHAVKVHYGNRPDIKKILSACQGSSIGVLVSGPSEMRHEVASICKSCSTENLHFESISFTW